MRLVWRKTVLFLFLYCELSSCRMQEQKLILDHVLIDSICTQWWSMFSFVAVISLRPPPTEPHQLSHSFPCRIPVVTEECINIRGKIWTIVGG